MAMARRVVRLPRAVLARRRSAGGRPRRDDRGSSTVETVILFPAIVVLIFSGPQVGMWYFAREGVEAAAVRGARAAAAYQALPGAGKKAAQDYLRTLDSGSITGYVVTERTAGTTVSIEIRAEVPRVIPLPGFDPHVDVTVTRQKERFTTRVGG